MKFIPVLTIALLSLFFSTSGNANPTPAPKATGPLPATWNANWIAAPGEDGREYGIYYFRKSIELATKPRAFVVHISADNRYKLYVNGTLASLGPARDRKSVV